MNSEQLGGHTLDELRRMCGEDVFGVRSTLREYQYESGLSATLEPLTETQGRYPLESMHEGTDPMTEDEVISELKMRLSKMLPNADLRVFKNTFMTTDVLVDCYALPPNSSQLDQANAAHTVRFALSAWKDGVPVGPLDARNVALPSGDKVTVRQLWGRDVPKFTKRTTTVAKAIALVVAWFKAAAATFSPPGGWALTARGAEPNLEGAEPGWRDAFPDVSTVDDLGSWATARDARDGTPPGVMGEARGAAVAVPARTRRVATEGTAGRGYAKPLQAARVHLLDGEKELAAAEAIFEGILASKPAGQARWDNPEDEAGRLARQVGGSGSAVRDTVADLDKLLASLRG